MEIKGKMLLKITGILLMIGGTLNFIVGVLGFFGGGVGAILGSRVEGVTTDMAATSGMILILYSLALLGYGVVSFISGFLGFKLAEDVRKAKTCVNMGIFLIFVGLILAVISVMRYGFTIGLVTGEIVPVLYLVGAVLNKNFK